MKINEDLFWLNILNWLITFSILVLLTISFLSLGIVALTGNPSEKIPLLINSFFGMVAMGCLLYFRSIIIKDLIPLAKKQKGDDKYG